MESRYAPQVTARDTPAHALRRLLESPGILQGPCVQDALSAKLVERAGFPLCIMGASKGEEQMYFLKGKKALFLIYQGLDEATFEKVAEAITSKEVRNKLNIIFKSVERVKRVLLQILRGDFEQLKLNENEIISNYVSRLITIVNLIKEMENKLTMYLSLKRYFVL
ncbi:hypothetical protein HPP92_012374 [Vanilla planifolia]|uniref:Uncharacterized protein n=1 Tax=Vanilla planifolia TaxID=51239 RepID=A0A835UYZ5_VANPL|nr:hypothetical protein HPP92_012374 [Vanilla planifolia]